MSVLVSLIITSYNRDRYLAEAIESVLTQTYPHFELLIWDDGSTDTSLDLAQHYAKLDSRIRVHATPHQGIAPAIKAAIAHTTAPFLGWVDSDDRLAPTALEETIALLDAQPDVGMVYTHYEIIDAQGHSNGLGNRCFIPYSKERLLIEFMTFHFRLMRRSVYEQVGGIDPTFQWSEDYDLCLKLSEVTQIQVVPKPLYFYRRHDDNITNNQFEAIRWAAIAIERAIVRRGLDQDYRLDVRLSGHFKLLPQSADLQNYLTAPLVSVIIPTHNRRDYLDRALQSVMAQTYPQVEIIVIDDASTDNTTTWLQTHYPQVHLLTLAQNQGAAAARNLGVEQATGQFLAFLDSDDEWHPHYLHRQIETLTQHPQAVLVYSNYLRSFGDDDPGVPIPLQPSDPDAMAAMLQACFIHTLSQVMLPTVRFNQVGGFDAQLRSCHDWDFYLRLFSLGSPIHCSDFLVRKRWLPNSLVTQAQGQTWLENGSRVLDLFFQRPENDRYADLRSTAAQSLRENIAHTQQWLQQGFAHTSDRDLPLVSIILTCYNAADWIMPCVQSGLAQTHTQIELLVIDRGSTDATIALIEQAATTAPDRVKLLQAPNVSQTVARNLGLEQAKGDYIQWLDVSDCLLPDKIARQLQALEQQRSIDIAVSDWEWCGVNSDQVVAQFTFPAPVADEILLHQLLDAGCPAAAHLLRRSAALQLHQFQAWHPDAPGTIDREYFTFAALLGLRFGVVAGMGVQQACTVASLPLRSLSTLDQVQNRQRMFARFQDVAALRSDDTLQPLHWTLLRQTWDLWSPAFAIVPLADQTTGLQHTQHNTVLPTAGTALTIAQALLQSSAARTLEDHARVVVQQVWHNLLVRVSRSPQPHRLEDFAWLSAQLAIQVGLAVEAAAEPLPLAQTTTEREVPAAVNLSQWLLDVPLFAPLFAQHRLRVYLVLEQLRQQGWLVQSPLPPIPAQTREPQPNGDCPAVVFIKGSGGQSA